MCAGAHMLMCLCGGQNATFKKLHVPICVCMCMMLHVWRSKNNLSINPFPPLYGSQGWSSMSWLWVSCCWPTEGSFPQGVCEEHLHPQSQPLYF